GFSIISIGFTLLSGKIIQLLRDISADCLKILITRLRDEADFGSIVFLLDSKSYFRYGRIAGGR
ncbi:MAG: hypothetical protein K8R34_05460, partial [Methanosarcinales archaeon]|nr:hypothetical protein [Methanosarcinales archaeon]